ncbi:MAG: hypothetical protein ACRDRY_23125 [Pseudonocardiaceae bacterium]
MSQTPIYDQLRGQRINSAGHPADADPQWIGHLEPHSPGDPPGGQSDRADTAGEVYLPAWTYPVGGERGAAAPGPRATPPPTAHARRMQAQRRQRWP